MALSRLPKLRGLVGMLALISMIVFAVSLGPNPARALAAVATPDPSVVPTAQSAVPAAATAAIPEGPAAAIPAQAAAAVPSSAAAAVPSSAAVATPLAHGPAPGADPRQPDPSPVTAAQAVPPDAQAVIDQAQAAPGGTSTAPKVPEPYRPGSANLPARRHARTSPSATTRPRHHATARPATSGAPAHPAASMPAVVVTRPSFSHPAPTVVHPLAEVHERTSADRRSRSHKLATMDISSPLGGLMFASGSLSPAGAAAGGSGIGVGSPAATLLSLVALCLLGTLLPGLLGLEIGPWRSARYTLRLERPG